MLIRMLRCVWMFVLMWGISIDADAATYLNESELTALIRLPDGRLSIAGLDKNEVISALFESSCASPGGHGRYQAVLDSSDLSEIQSNDWEMENMYGHRTGLICLANNDFDPRGYDHHNGANAAYSVVFDLYCKHPEAQQRLVLFRSSCHRAPFPVSGTGASLESPYRRLDSNDSGYFPSGDDESDDQSA